MWTSPNKLLLPAGLSQPLPLSCTCSIIPVIFVRFLGRKMPPLLQTWTQAVAPVLLVGAAGVWYNVVSRDVPEPYLVRLFGCNSSNANQPRTNSSTYHKLRNTVEVTIRGILRSQRPLACMLQDCVVKQAKQADHVHRYLVAKLFEPLFGCDTSALRWLNAVSLCMVCPLSYCILRMKRTPVKQAQQGSKKGKAIEQLETDDRTLALDLHSALNIALFPPLFFFSALFYTDVMSTLAALLSFSVFLGKRTATGNTFDSFATIFFGTVALFFRQTNIFWVAVFPAGLTVIEALKANEPSSGGQAEKSTLEILQESWSQSIIYDCPVEDAGVEGMLFLAIWCISTNQR
jgi:alpha-1,2-glucosyltransferase